MRGVKQRVVLVVFRDEVEVADDAALLVDPFSEASIAEGMTEMLDENIREDLVEKGLERAKDFSWDKAAEAIWNSLMKAINE